MHGNNIRQFKIGLREHYKSIRVSMIGQQKDRLDKKIRKKFFATKEYKFNNIIFTYVSKEIEVDTKDIILKAIQDNKIVAVPKCITDENIMEFYRIKSFEDLDVGVFGVLEPIVERCELITDFSRGLCIVPGFSFDCKGYRLGYGKGYYDRFLSVFEGNTVGLCYHNCMRMLLPHGYFDKPVDILVTDTYIKTIRKQRSNTKK